jgi:hypothetical protein
MTTTARTFKPFPLGQVVATPGALEALQRNNTSALDLLQRHARGDWGVVDAEDTAANDDATVNGGRLLSAYVLDDGTRIWLLTEGDRSVTSALLPEEY